MSIFALVFGIGALRACKGTVAEVFAKIYFWLK